MNETNKRAIVWEYSGKQRQRIHVSSFFLNQIKRLIVVDFFITFLDVVWAVLWVSNFHYIKTGSKWFFLQKPHKKAKYFFQCCVLMKTHLHKLIRFCLSSFRDSNSIRNRSEQNCSAKAKKQLMKRLNKILNSSLWWHRTQVFFVVLIVVVDQIIGNLSY